MFIQSRNTNVGLVKNFELESKVGGGEQNTLTNGGRKLVGHNSLFAWSHVITKLTDHALTTILYALILQISFKLC